MVDFSVIFARACERKGGEAAVVEGLPDVQGDAALRAVPDDRYFSMMSLRIFRAGLKHSLVDAKWPAFEEAFAKFSPPRVRAMSEEAVEGLMKDARLIRHFGKLRAVHANGAAFCTIAAEKGSFGNYLAEWPITRIVELWDDLSKRFQQMGGNSGPMFLRMAGKDTFIFSEYVVKALLHWKVADRAPSGKGDRKKMQAVFNDWASATGRPLSHLSRILAQSVD
jgi:3-methyladenine DNA glycosylase Tag